MLYGADLDALVRQLVSDQHDVPADAPTRRPLSEGCPRKKDKYT